MSAFINLNGKIIPNSSAGVPADARAFRYGYGLFETMLVRDGSIRLEALHWARLKAGMETLGIHGHPHFFKELSVATQKIISRNRHEALGRIRVQVWPSSGGLYDGDAFSAQYCIETFPLDADMLLLNENGLTIGIAAGIVKPADAFSHIKSCNALPYALAARQAKAARWNDALLLNQHGRIADSSIANVFWLSNGVVCTPPLSEGCVAGVMRQHLLSLLPAWGYAVGELAATTQTLIEAECIMLTNAVRGIRWVSAYCGQEKAAGPAAELHDKLLRSL